MHQEQATVVVDDRRVGADLGRAVAELGPEPFEHGTGRQLRDRRVLVRGQFEQLLVALAVVAVLGEVQAGARDRADLVEELQVVGQERRR
jgi:hypothetical protein